MPAILPPDDPTLLHLRDLLGSDFASQLAVLVNRVGVTQVAVRVEAHVCSTGGDHAGSVVVEPLPHVTSLLLITYPGISRPSPRYTGKSNPSIFTGSAGSSRFSAAPSK
jgi:hypothetical protein